MSEYIRGRIIRLFGNGPRANRWFAGIIKFSDGSTAKISGTANTLVSVGMTVECEADYVDTNFGPQYQPVKGHLINRALTDRREVVRFLESDLFPGIGSLTAEVIYAAFGTDTMAMLTDHMDIVAMTCHLKKNQVESLKAGIRSDTGVAEMLRAFPSMRPVTAQRILDQHPNIAVSSVVNEIYKEPYRMLYQEYHVSMKETDMIALLDLRKSVMDKSRIEMMIFVAIGNFMKDRNATYVRISDPVEWRMFFMNYFLKLDMYQPLPDFWDGEFFDENCLAKHIDQWPDKSTYAPFRTSECRMDGNGNFEVGLYQSRMLHAEEQLAKAMAGAYYESPAACQIRFVKFHRILKERRKAGISMPLSQEQLDGVSAVFQHRVSFLSGGPGRGKTRTLAFLIDMWNCVVGADILLLAPTGKAVNRMKAQTKYSNAETVARFLVTNADASKPIKDAMGNSMDISASTLVVIDESSMLNFVDADNLWEKVKGCTIVFVGDKDQLSPIDPGPFLQECLRSHSAFITVLTKNFRVESEEIGDNADKILAGKMLSGGDFTENFQFWPCEENPVGGAKYSQAEQFIMECYKDHMKTCDYSDVMVIAPFASERYRLSSANLNKMIQNEMNPLQDHQLRNIGTDDVGSFFEDKGVQAGASDGDGLLIRIGDRLMSTKNNMDLSWHVFANDHVGYDADNIDPSDDSNKGIFNGDVGTVIRSYRPAGNRTTFCLLIALDDSRSEQERQSDPRPTKYVWVTADVDNKGMSRLKDWSLGYALSVHKAQGSEAEHVIIALSDAGYRSTMYRQMYGGMPFLTRNMLYTAVTRAKKSVTIVGSRAAFEACVRTPYQYSNVRLAEAIDEAQMTAISPQT